MSKKESNLDRRYDGTQIRNSFVNFHLTFYASVALGPLKVEASIIVSIITRTDPHLQEWLKYHEKDTLLRQAFYFVSSFVHDQWRYNPH